MPDDVKIEPTSPAKQSQAITVSDTGLLTPKSHEEVWRVCGIWLKSGLCPESFKKPEQVFFAHQTLASLGVNPLTYMRFTAFIRNSFTLYGDLPLSLVNLNKKLSRPPSEFFINGKYEKICVANKNLQDEAWAAVCQMWAEGCEEPYERVFTVKMAEDAGKLPAKAGPWASHRLRMLQLKARGWLIKDLFPEILNGVAQGEYDHDEMPRGIRDAKRVDVIANQTAGLDLNEAYGSDA